MSATIKILIIDHTEHTGQRIRSLLGTNLHATEIMHSNNLNEGMAFIVERQPNLIILDAGSFGPIGLQSVKKIKSSIKNSILVMFTNYTHKIYKNICLEMGADFFFDKTTEFEELINLIDKNLSNDKLNIKLG